jgi:putative ABC transport system permease protein
MQNNKLVYFINILIFAKVKYETSFDSFHSNNNRIFRLVRTTIIDGRMEYRAGVSFPITSAIREQIPEIENASEVHFNNICIVQTANSNNDQNKVTQISGLAYVDSHFFEIFDFKNTDFHWLGGLPDKLFFNPNSVAVSYQTANKVLEVRMLLVRI